MLQVNFHCDLTEISKWTFTESSFKLVSGNACYENANSLVVVLMAQSNYHDDDDDDDNDDDDDDNNDDDDKLILKTAPALQYIK